MRKYMALAASLLGTALLVACGDDSSGAGERPSQSVPPPASDSGVPVVDDSGGPRQGEWDTDLGLPGISGKLHPTVYASARLGQDRLVIAGSFEQAGPVPAPFAALWDGKEWTAIGEGLSEEVHRMAATPSGELFGTTDHLTADGAGYISTLYKWNKSSWAPVVTLDGLVTDIDVDVHGTLYVVGTFTTIDTGRDTRAIANVAKYDGATWSALGKAPEGPSTVRALGEKVYVGGRIPEVGVQAYDGTEWTPIPFGPDASGVVSEIAEENGSLLVAGSFQLDGSSTSGSLARLKGSDWELVGGGVELEVGFETFAPGDVRDLLVDGTKVYVTGLFVRAGGAPVSHVAMFDTESSLWSAMGGGISGSSGGVTLDTIPFGNTLTAAGSGIYVGGGFGISGGHAAVGIARWDGTAWSTLDDPKVKRMGVSGDAIEVVAADEVGAIYVGGNFELTGGSVHTPAIARFANGVWSPLGDGFDGRVNAIAFDGPSVFAGGLFARSGSVATPFVARWDGTAWSSLGDGLDGTVAALVVGPDRKLYAGGDFGTSGGTTLNFIGVWDGTRWSALGSGLDGTVTAIAFDDRGQLYAGGSFTHAGEKDARGIALWNGSEWSAVGEGLNGYVQSIVFYDGKPTAGGSFQLVGDADGSSYSNLAAWDGSTWKPVGGGTHGAGPQDGLVHSLSVSDGQLYVGGLFTSVGDESRGALRSDVRFLARWDGKTWSNFGGTPNDGVQSILLTDDALWIGGFFTLIGQVRSNLIGRYAYVRP